MMKVDRRSGRRSILLPAAAAVLLVSGVGCVGVAVAGQVAPPPPVPASSALAPGAESSTPRDTVDTPRDTVDPPRDTDTPRDTVDPVVDKEDRARAAFAAAQNKMRAAAHADDPARLQKGSDKKPAAKKPAANKPVANKPVVKKPVANKPVANKPVVEKPVAKKPVAKKPVVKKAPVQPVRTSPPVRLSVGPLQIDTDLVPLGLTGSGQIEAPKEYDRAGWFTQGPLPGEIGAAVIAGHVDSSSGPAVFYHLSSLKPGAEIVVERKDGSTATFRVDRLAVYSKDNFPTVEVYATNGRELRLITCGGAFSDGDYQDNVVVFASLVAEKRARA